MKVAMIPLPCRTCPKFVAAQPKQQITKDSCLVILCVAAPWHGGDRFKLWGRP